MRERLSTTVVPAPSRRSGVRALHAALGFVVLALGLGFGAPACSETGETGTTSGDPPCTGVVVGEGCEGQCTPDRCKESNTCSGNRCVLTCASHLDCIPGEQSCLPAKEDGTDAELLACQYHGRAAVGAHCPFGGECAPAGVCPDGSGCKAELYAQCGGNGTACVRDEAACAGDPFCTKGKCPGDGAACTVLTCEAAQCRQVVMGACPDGSACVTGGYAQCSDGSTCEKDWATCGNLPDCNLGACKDGSRCVTSSCGPEECKPLECVTTGAGDAEAYCAVRDCDDDADCALGFFCGVVRDPHEICGSTPKKGNNSLCGTTKEPCIDPAKAMQAGGSYFEGPSCLLRKSCLKRDPCSPCATDLDCSLVPGTRCVQAGPDKRCVADCAKTSDCATGFTCTDGSCLPSFAGGCKGTGKFCEPCQSDADCGTASTPGLVACFELDGLTHERACVDLSFSQDCMTDADCPESPGGVHALCIDEALGAGPGDDLYHKCYLPGHRASNGSIESITCW